MTNPVKNKFSSLKASWYVWLFPVIALGVSAYFLRTYLGEKGPEIKIYFDDGGSLQAEKTRIRYRGVNIGMVKKVGISEDGKKVVAHVNLQKDSEHFAVKGTKFWVVSPKVSFQGITGLETLIEGTYIAAQPGNPDGEWEEEFNGKLGNDSNDPLEDTVAYYLETPNAGSVGSGDSITFRGLKIGSVTKVTLSKTAQTVVVQVNIQNKYVRLIRNNSVFWRKSAVQANLGLFNSELKIESLDSLLRGGIDVFTPTEAGPIANAQTKFPLADKAPKDWEKWNPQL